MARLDRQDRWLPVVRLDRLVQSYPSHLALRWPSAPPLPLSNYLHCTRRRTAGLWDVSDIVAVLEASEKAGQQAA